MKKVLISGVGFFVFLTMVFFLGSCGSNVSENAADNNDEPAVDLNQKLSLDRFDVGGIDVSGGAPPDLVFPAGEPVDINVALRFEFWDSWLFGEWDIVARIYYDANENTVFEDPEIVFEDTYHETVSAAGVYEASTSYTPTEAGSYYLAAALYLDGFWFAGYDVYFTVVEGGGLPEFDMSGDCAHGRFMLKGVEVSLVDEDCDGLLEEYACGGGNFVAIAHGETVFECGLRIVNGTVGDDHHDFRYDDGGSSGVPVATVFAGGLGADYIAGSSDDDLIIGSTDGDNLDGRGGNDAIACGSAFDSGDGEGGNDVIHGGDDPDHLVGKGGNDTIYGGPGGDFINGYEGDDWIDSGEGDDLVYGGNGNDEIYCGDGGDICKGQEGNDLLRGGAEADYCSGGGGADNIDCGSGEDLITGRNGDDIISSCDGSVDDISGDDGTNVCTLDPVDTAEGCDVTIPCP